jgi:hypothetical protein
MTKDINEKYGNEPVVEDWEDYEDFLDAQEEHDRKWWWMDEEGEDK